MWWIHRTLKTVVEWISLAILIGLTGVVVYATTFRYLGSSPSWYDEVAQISRGSLTLLRFMRCSIANTWVLRV
jgi:TRAP-type C4-dicarboxylate transport system permease small subunit